MAAAELYWLSAHPPLFQMLPEREREREQRKTRDSGREKICECIWVEREIERVNTLLKERDTRVHLVISRETSLTIAHTLGYLNKPLTLAII